MGTIIFEGACPPASKHLPPPVKKLVNILEKYPKGHLITKRKLALLAGYTNHDSLDPHVVDPSMKRYRVRHGGRNWYGHPDTVRAAIKEGGQ